MTNIEKDPINPQGLIPVAKVAPPSTPEYWYVPRHELLELSKGTPVTLYLIFATFFLSLSGSIIGSTLPILVSNNTSIHWLIQGLFYFGLASFVVGSVLLLVWWFRQRKVESKVAEILKRMPENGGSS